MCLFTVKYNGGMLLFAERVDGAVLTQRAPHRQSLVVSGIALWGA